MTLSSFAAYIKQLWRNKPDTSTPVTAERLAHMEEGIKGNSDAIEEIAAAVVSQIINDPDKIASMAAVYAVNQKVATLDGKVGDTAQLPDGATDVVTAIAKQNSNLGQSLYYKGEAVNTNNLETNGIYSLTPSTEMGTTGITANWGIVLCFGNPGYNHQNEWRWQRVFYTSTFRGGYRTKLNDGAWSSWSVL